MGDRGEICGAVTGALMVIGLKYGKIEANDKEAREKTYELVREFVNEFRSCHGSLVCKELLGYDLSDPQEKEAARKKGLFDTLCSQLVRDATEILEKIL